MSQDVVKNNILHLAGKLAPRNKLNALSSAALQVQSELKWFKEVENIVPPDYNGKTNPKGQTPAIVSTEEHKELVKEGKKWMKDATTSGSVAAAFFATIAFAAKDILEIALVFASALLALSLFAYSQCARLLDVLISVLAPTFLSKRRISVLY
ncbi:uncharacterized protein LOC123226818 [Mangifera indica]|uniref:uncharacterized protein LOC123226818 n=1 Tax=Mangifera indica TaxID=29780 RepID=UPI001CFA144B|nr:uncharacterized protein LOC123226818 [Mangifera indica]